MSSHSDLTIKIYSEFLRKGLLSRMPEHADLIRSIPDERLVAMDKENARRGCEKIQTNRAMLMQASASVQVL